MIHPYKTSSPNMIICDGQESNYVLKEWESPARPEVLQDQPYNIQSRILDSNHPSYGLVTELRFLVASGRDWHCTEGKTWQQKQSLWSVCALRWVIN